MIHTKGPAHPVVVVVVVAVVVIPWQLRFFFLAVFSGVEREELGMERGEGET